MVHESMQKAADQWTEGPLAQSLGKCPEREAGFRTLSGRPVERLYLPDANLIEQYQERLGFPGQYPFTRGVQPTMYRGRLWTMRQYAGFGTAEESNRRFRYLLEHGSTGLSVAFDLPTQIGLESADPMTLGEVGKGGVAIDTLADMETLFAGIPLDRVSTSMTINAPAAILLAMYVAVAQKQGIRLDQLNGTIQNDILKEYTARGTYIFPPRPSLRLIANTFEYCRQCLPKWNSISISGYHIREAGASAVQEVGYTLANAICYIQAALDAGLSIDDFAPRLTFFFAAQSDLFEEVAKFRAARRLYARIMKERFHARDPRSLMLRFHTQTSGVALTAQQSDNNVVRVTLHALAAVLGGTQSLHTNCKEEALSLPTEDSVTLALRTQQIIAHESGVAGTVDPLAGCFFVERLTDQIEAEAAAIIDEIDAAGGVVSAIESGAIVRAIEESGYRWCSDIEHKRRILVGVNEYVTECAPAIDLFEVSEEARDQQIAKVNAIRARRDGQAVEHALVALRRAAANETQNLMPFILDAVNAYATNGEICGVLRRVFGEYEEEFQK